MVTREKLRHQRYHTLLQDTYAERKKKNPAYSLRAFARDLGISVTALSQVLAYKRKLAPKNIKKLADKLSLSPVEMNLLGEKGLSTHSREGDRRLLSEDSFRLMSDWYYFAILNLAKTPHCKSDPKWIADRLAISVIETRAALERLCRLGLIKITNGYVVRTSESLTTTVDIPSSAGRKLQKGHLTLALEALDEVPVLKREITSVTMAIDPKKIKLAKQMIVEFRNELCEFLESGKQESVYVLALQLFPLEASNRGNA